MNVLVLHNSPRDGVISGEQMSSIEQTRLLEKAGFSVEELDLSGSLMNVARAQAMISNKIATLKPDVLIVHRWFPHGSFIHELPLPTLIIVHAYLPVCIAGTLVKGTERCYKCVSGSALNGVVNRCYKGSIWQSSIAGLMNSFQRSRGIIRKAEIVAFPSNRALSVFVEKMPSISSNSTVLPFSVEIPELPVKELALRSGFVFVGQLESYKGIDTLIDAWPDDLELSIIGIGSLQVRVVEAAAQRSNIHYLGRKSREEVYEILGRSRALIFPSKMPETFGRVFAEACATGTWTIALDETTVSDEISRLGLGSIGGSINELTRIAAQLSDYDPNLLREAYDNNYSPQVWTARVSALLGKLSATT